MSVFDARRDTLDVLWEREFDDGDVGVMEGSADCRGVSGGGEDGNGGGTLVEEAGEVEERDGMAMRHER